MLTGLFLRGSSGLAVALDSRFDLWYNGLWTKPHLVTLCYNLTEGNKLMSDTKVKMIVVDSGELYVFGKLISRHHEMPWLFSITDVYKACEKPIKKEALRKGKNSDTFFATRAPSQWLRTKDEEGIKRSAIATRKRISKHGVYCGFGVNNTDVRRRTSVSLSELSDKELVIKVVKGGPTKGSNKTVQGTYVCQNWIVQYAAFLNESLSEEITNIFISVLNGYIEEVTKKVEKNERIAKGTQTRIENIQLNHALVEACGMKKVLPMKVQQGINEGVLGMTATKYKKLHGIKEPFNDNLSKDQVDIKNAGISLATYTIRNHPKPKLSGREGTEIGKDSSLRAKIIFTDPEVIKYLDSAVSRLEALS